MSLLDVSNLHTQFTSSHGSVKAVNGVNFQLEQGEILAIVGESGSGKSITAMSIIGLLPKKNAEIVDGKIFFNSIDLTKLSEKELNKIRGKEMSIIFQNPLTSLDPSIKVGKQLIESITFTQNIKRKNAELEAREWLEKVGISDVDRVMNTYPHTLSGGMRQRVIIAMAISSRPKLIIADEPTTALDATIQKQILTLLKQINDEMNTSIIIITHDFGVVANLSDNVAVMYAGKIVEYGETKQILTTPKHPYTQGLIGSIPKLGDRQRIKRLTQIEGTPPDLSNLPKGCSFAERCREATDRCLEAQPNLFSLNQGHKLSCFEREVNENDRTG